VVKMMIREAKPTDAEYIQQINNQSLGYELDLKTTTIQLTKILSSTNARIFVAELENQVIGYVHGCDYDCTYALPFKDVKALAVSVEYQNMGIGKKLIKQLEKWAKADGCDGVRLVSGIARIEAHEFYLRCGYQERKLQKNFFKLV